MTNLDELKQRPTDVQIRKVSRLVWEAMGNRYCPEHKWEKLPAINKWGCSECPAVRTSSSRGLLPRGGDRPPPDITDPAVFWPLVEEMKQHEPVISFDKELQQWDMCFYDLDNKDRWHNTESPGLAVGYAYLKIKEQKK
jgi:hypothetical protein